MAAMKVNQVVMRASTMGGKEKRKMRGGDGGFLSGSIGRLNRR